MPRVVTALVLLLLLTGIARAGAFEDGLTTFRQASAESDPEQARDLYRQAATTWESLAGRGIRSTRLETNIGNARAFAGDLGEAVLAYRRALLIDPGNDRARDALDAIRLELGIGDGSGGAGSGLLQALFFWHDSLTARTRQGLFALAWVGGFVLLLLTRRRKRFRPLAALALVAAIALLASLLVSEQERRDAADAVLLVRTEGRTGDGDFYSPSHTTPLPAGVELKILERRPHDHGWIHGELRNGTKTWVPESTVRLVEGGR